MNGEFSTAINFELLAADFANVAFELFADAVVLDLLAECQYLVCLARRSRACLFVAVKK